MDRWLPPPPKRLCRETVYSYRSACSAVEPFVEKYARATCFVAKKTGLTPKDLKYTLIKAFMYKNTSWNIARDVIKRVELHDLYDSLSPLSVRESQKYLTVVKVMLEDEWLDAEKP